MDNREFSTLRDRSVAENEINGVSRDNEVSRQALLNDDFRVINGFI